MSKNSKEYIFNRFPVISEAEDTKDKKNPAIHLYGRRFYRDQSAVEYLIEFLMVFSSYKNLDEEGDCSFDLISDDDSPPYYLPEDRVGLKLFSFFSNSKLETRHPIHNQEYTNAIIKIKESIHIGNEQEKEEAVNLLQSFLYGFSGVSKNRTWVTNCFLPISKELLAREVNWSPKNNKNIYDWDSSLSGFSNNSRNFMGRGGEVLFLQISYVFDENLNVIDKLSGKLSQSHYSHVQRSVSELKANLTENLKMTLSIGNIEPIVGFIENNLAKYKLKNSPKPSLLGWIPQSYQEEALLFAYELNNICSAKLNNIEKMELLQTSCVMQVIRTLCFQAARLDEKNREIELFWGNYAFIVCEGTADINDPSRKFAQRSLASVEEILFRAVRHTDVVDKIPETSGGIKFKNADDNTLGHFKRFAKELGLIIPRNGGGERFVLNQTLLRFFVAVLISPGERIYLNTFYERLFAHYGIAINGEHLAAALKWTGDNNHGYYIDQSSNSWLEESLKQGGFLIELSDSVSMVRNPG